MIRKLIIHMDRAACSLFSPAGRSAERSEAMRGAFLQFVASPPSSGATRHLLPAGEKRFHIARAHNRNIAATFTQETLHAPRL